MQGKREKDFPGVGLKKLKKVLKRCRRDLESQRQRREGEEEIRCPGSCAGNWVGHSFPFLFVFLFVRAWLRSSFYLFIYLFDRLVLGI